VLFSGDLGRETYEGGRKNHGGKGGPTEEKGFDCEKCYTITASELLRGERKWGQKKSALVVLGEAPEGHRVC